MKTQTKNEIKEYAIFTLIYFTFAFLLMLMFSIANNAQATTIENQNILNEVNNCKAISIHYLENGKYNSGDSDLLFMNLSIDEQKAKASKLIIDSEKAEITNVKSNCNINIHYKL